MASTLPRHPPEQFDRQIRRWRWEVHRQATSDFRNIRHTPMGTRWFTVPLAIQPGKKSTHRATSDRPPVTAQNVFNGITPW
eukprot:7343371-Karenia_brevis.AAC.1